MSSAPGVDSTISPSVIPSSGIAPMRTMKRCSVPSTDALVLHSLPSALTSNGASTVAVVTYWSTPKAVTVTVCGEETRPGTDVKCNSEASAVNTGVTSGIRTSTSLETIASPPSPSGRLTV